MIGGGGLITMRILIGGRHHVYDDSGDNDGIDSGRAALATDIFLSSPLFVKQKGLPKNRFAALGVKKLI